MTGIWGIAFDTNRHDGRTCFQAMMRRMHRADWHLVEHKSHATDGVCMGRISLGFVNVAPQPARSADSRMMAVMDGEIYNHEECARQLGLPPDPRGARGDVDLLLEGYRREGVDFFGSLNGKFSAAIWDTPDGKLLLVSDKFGMQPLYYVSSLPGKLLFASQIKALLADREVARRVDPQAIAQFFTFGQTWGDATMFEAVRLLPPGACLTYDLSSERVMIQRYYRLPLPQERGTPAELLDQIDARFKRAVDQCSSGEQRLGLSLSGGLDARTILGVMDRSQSLTAICLGMPGSSDHRSARQLASLAGCRYSEFVLDQHFLSRFEDHLEEMVQLTDGHYLSQCIVMPTLSHLRELGVQVLLRGHAGELMHMKKAYAFSLDNAALQLRNQQALQQWLYGHLRSFVLSSIDEPVLAMGGQDETESIANEALGKCLDESAACDSHVHRIWHLFVTQFLRRDTAMSLKKFGSVVETRLPYMAPDVIETLLCMPPELKLDEMIQKYILQRHRPEFLRVTNVNTGCRIGAGRIARSWNYGKMKVCAKLGVRGYQPYERLGLWLRRELKPLVQRVLLSDACLERGIFRPDTVSKAVRQHLAGQRNHTFLLLAMIIVELGQRRLVDDSPEPLTEMAAVRGA